MKLQTELCIAVGIPIRELEMMQTYLAAGAIVNSQLLKPYLLPYVKKGVLPQGARLHVLTNGEVPPDVIARIREEAYVAVQSHPKTKQSGRAN